jgi:hypothetical protein
MHKLFEIPSITLFLCTFYAFSWLKTSALSVFSVAKNPFNQRLINYLYAFGIFTLVESALQIRLFMQNEPNFRKSQMNVTDLLTKDYDKKDTWSSGKNEHKTNPNEPNFKKAKMNVTSYITKGYDNISNWAICENEPKTNPIQTRRRARGGPNKLADAPVVGQFQRFSRLDFGNMVNSSNKLNTAA